MQEFIQLLDQFWKVSFSICFSSIQARAASGFLRNTELKQGPHYLVTLNLIFPEFTLTFLFCGKTQDSLITTVYLEGDLCIYRQLEVEV